MSFKFTFKRFDGVAIKKLFLDRKLNFVHNFKSADITLKFGCYVVIENHSKSSHSDLCDVLIVKEC